MSLSYEPITVSTPLPECGVVDWRDAINSALASSMDVVLPPGEIFVSDGLNFTTSGQRIRGAGRKQTTIKSASLHTTFPATRLADLAIEDLTIDKGGTAAPAVYFADCARPSVTRVGVLNVGDCCALGFVQDAPGGGCVEGDINDCYLDNISNHAVYLSQGAGHRVRNNVMRRVKYAGVNAGSVYNLSISENDIEGVLDPSGYGLVRMTGTCMNPIVSGNHIRYGSRGIMMLGGVLGTISSNVVQYSISHGVLLQAVQLGGGANGIQNVFTGNVLKESWHGGTSGSSLRPAFHIASDGNPASICQRNEVMANQVVQNNFNATHGFYDSCGGNFFDMNRSNI